MSVLSLMWRFDAVYDGERGWTRPSLQFASIASDHQNGYGEESAGDELQTAREELAALVGHVAAAEVEETEVPWIETHAQSN